MIEEFVKGSSVKAKLCESKKDLTGSAGIARLSGAPIENVIRVVLFVGSDKSPFLAVIPFADSPSIAKLCSLRSCERAIEVIGEDAEEICGYPAGIIPPISIYGIDTFIDSKVMLLSETACFAGEKNKVIVIAPQEIVNSSWSEPAIGDITD